jgi:tRNA A37 threonylcarbamoyladenosine dehydratase
MMQEHALTRTEALIGAEALARLRKASVAILGVGGVGSFAAEALARSGIGSLCLIDKDEVCVTNINRQIHATTKTVGQPKVSAMAARIRDIDPAVQVQAVKEWVTAENLETLLSASFDYIIDAVDMVSVKIAVAQFCHSHRIPLISSMGAGNKLDPAAFRVLDLYQTRQCPLARVLRRELRKKGIPSLKVVASEEQPRQVLSLTGGEEGGATSRKRSPSSIAFVPSVAGLILAGEVVRDLIAKPEAEEN